MKHFRALLFHQLRKKQQEHMQKSQKFTSNKQHNRGRMEEKSKQHQARSLRASPVSLAQVQYRSTLACSDKAKPDSPGLCGFLLPDEFSRRRRNQMLGHFFCCRLSEGLRGVVVLTSTAQHRETWSSQQDVVNVASSVGTRGS